MPEREKGALTDGELSEMFLNIGRAKEVAAEGILAEQRKEEEERRRHIKGRLRLFGGIGDEVNDIVDYDEEERLLAQEIEWVRTGKVRKYDDDTVVLLDEDSERPDALENSLLLESMDEDGVELLDALPFSIEEFAESEVELAGAEIEPELVQAYFASVYFEEKGIGIYAFDVYKGETLVERVTDTLHTDKPELVMFAGAAKMLRLVQFTKCTSALLYMTKEAAELLRKNAIFGLTGNYGPIAVDYIKQVKELSSECYLRVLSENTTNEMSLVKQRMSAPTL